MCHSATARPTHEVVVGRAVLVSWNPPGHPEQNLSRVLCLVLLPVHRKYRDGVLWLGGTPSWRFGGWPVTCSDVIGEKDAKQGRHSTPLAGGCGRAVWQQCAPPPPSEKHDADGGGVHATVVVWWVARSHRREGRPLGRSTRLVGR